MEICVGCVPAYLHNNNNNNNNNNVTSITPHPTSQRYIKILTFKDTLLFCNPIYAYGTSPPPPPPVT
jgi:hypothetical protein